MTSPDDSYVDHYQKMIDDGLILFPDWIENILLWKQKGMISDNEMVNSIRFLYNEGMIFPDDKLPRDELVEYKN